MANTLNATSYQRIARIGFNVLRAKLMQLRAFTTDFSAEVKSEGSSVDMRIYPSATAAKSLSTATGSGGAGGSRSAAVGDLVIAKKTVTLNQDPVTGFAFTDEEIASMNNGIFSDLLVSMVETHGNAIADNVLDYVFSLVTKSNFTNDAFVGAATAFDLEEVIDINATLSDAGWPTHDDGRVAMVLKNSYRAALKKDGAVQDISKSGISGVIARGALDAVDAFRLYPSATLTDNSENLTGFVALPESIAIATRTVEPQGRVEHFEVLTDPETGLSVAYRVWFDPDKGKMYHTFELLYGATVVDGAKLQTIRSAAYNA